MKAELRKTRVLVLGSGIFTKNLLHEIRQSQKSIYQIIGVVGDLEEAASHGYGHSILGSIDDLCHIIDKHRPDTIIVGFPYNRSCLTDQLLMEARCGRNIKIEHADDVYERLAGKLPLETLAPKELIYSDLFRPDPVAVWINRMMSFGFALLGIMVFAPLMLVLALLIKLDTVGPVLFVQPRCGAGGRSFRLFKFRTMSVAGAGVSEWEGDNRHRITRVGRWLRRFRLDELPQFFNVLLGDMNLVGPRPHPFSSYAMLVLVSRNTPECGVQIPFYALRCSVRPGITGWAQVRYRYANNMNEEMEKLRFDLYYLKHYSFWLDLRIIIETAWIVLVGHHAMPDMPAQEHARPRLVTSD